jgi:threonine dehydrogenase-like Zn-dependent dehydrogenase
LRDTSDARLDLARKVLPDARIQPVGAATDERFDTVFDATGNIGAMNAGLSHVAHGGAYVLLSVVKGDLVFPDPEFHKRECTLIASRNALHEDFRHVMEMMRAGRVPTQALATHETSFDAAVENLPRWASERGGLIKAIIRV